MLAPPAPLAEPDVVPVDVDDAVGVGPVDELLPPVPLAELVVVPAAGDVEDGDDVGPAEELLSSPPEVSPLLLLAQAPTAAVPTMERMASPLKRVTVFMVAAVRRSGPKVSQRGEGATRAGGGTRRSHQRRGSYVTEPTRVAGGITRYHSFVPILVEMRGESAERWSVHLPGTPATRADSRLFAAP